MAQQRRMIYAKILGSDQYNRLSFPARTLYIATLLLADDDGRLNGDARYLKGQAFIYDDEATIEKVREWKAEIMRVGLIKLYIVDGAKYLEHPKWKEYQKIRKDMYVPSKIPKPKDGYVEPPNRNVTEALQDRNGAVTEPYHKSSKVKSSKVKVNKLAALNSAAGVEKKGYESKTDGKELNRLMELFGNVNPSVYKLYGHITHRKALDRLVVAHGSERVEKMILSLTQSNGKPYAPTITTPCQLEDNLGKLMAWYTKNKSAAAGKGKEIIGLD